MAFASRLNAISADFLRTKTVLEEAYFCICSFYFKIVATRLLVIKFFKLGLGPLFSSPMNVAERDELIVISGFFFTRNISASSLVSPLLNRLSLVVDWCIVRSELLRSRFARFYGTALEKLLSCVLLAEWIRERPVPQSIGFLSTLSTRVRFLKRVADMR